MRLPTWPLSSAATRASVIVSSRDRLADRLVGPGRSSGRTPPEWPLGSGKWTLTSWSCRTGAARSFGHALSRSRRPRAFTSRSSTTPPATARWTRSPASTFGRSRYPIIAASPPAAMPAGARARAGTSCSSTPTRASCRRPPRRSPQCSTESPTWPLPRRGSWTTTARSTFRSGASRRCARPTRTRSSCTDCSAGRPGRASSSATRPTTSARAAPTGPRAPACWCGGPSWRSSAAGTKGSSCTARTRISAAARATAGYDVRFEPAAVAHHAGGASAPRPSLAHVLAQSRVRYARKHRGRVVAELERAGIALTALTHMAISRGGRAARAGHAAALRAALRPARAS